jgi:hypothetical protein
MNESDTTIRVKKLWWKRPEVILAAIFGLPTFLGAYFAFCGHVEDVWHAPEHIDSLNSNVSNLNVTVLHLDWEVKQIRGALNLDNMSPKERQRFESSFQTNAEDDSFKRALVALTETNNVGVDK